MNGTTLDPAYVTGAGRGPSARSANRLRRLDRVGNALLYGLCALAALLAAVTMVLIAYQVVSGAGPAMSKFGLGFLFHTAWQPNFNLFGAGSLIFGTAVTSAVALALGAPIAISIGLYLSLMAPSGVRTVVAPLVEMLAAIPSVILGFWGLIILAPFVHEHVEPFLHSTLGFLPIFGTAATT